MANVHHNPGPMDAHPGLLEYVWPDDVLPPGHEVADAITERYAGALAQMPDNGGLQPFSQRLRVLRTNAGLSLRDLAKRAELDYTYISHLEAGRRAPSHAVLLGIAAALGVHPGELLSGSESAKDEVLGDDEAQETQAIILCLREVLRDYENLDPACALHVWVPEDDKRPWGRKKLDEAATQAQAGAARRALAKLEGGS
jgi:transcriptional regulator with XRE-family HTH domain